MLKKDQHGGARGLRALYGHEGLLQTWVKVKENWRDSQTMIRNFGYE